MEIHNLLQRQISKLLPQEFVENPDIQLFIQSVHETYISYERDIYLSKHAFQISEQEFDLLHKNLEKTLEKQQQSIQTLTSIIQHYENQSDIPHFSSEVDELQWLSLYLSELFEEKQQSEQAYKTQTQLLKTLLTNLQSGILVEDEHRRILFTNQLFCDMFDIPVNPTDMIGTDCSNSAEQSKHLFENPEQFVSDINQLLNDKRMVIQSHLTLQDGRILERDYIPIYVENIYKGHMWRYQDVSTRESLKLQLQQSEFRNRLVMENALNAIVMVDGKGKIVFWNAQATQLFGWDKSEILGQKLKDTIVPNDVVRKQLQALFNNRHLSEKSGGPNMLTCEARTKDGQKIWVELTYTPIELEDMLHCAFIQDITERKRNQDQLQFLKEKYQNIIANMNLGLIEVDQHEHIVFSNQTFADMSGYSIEELLGKKPSTLFIKETQGIKTINEKVQLRRQGISDVYQIQIKDKQGKSKWWTISGAPNYDSDGQLVGSIGIHLDVTDQKEMELALAQQKLKAEQASLAKEAFLANMSHEIRTPLNALIGFLRELQRTPLNERQLQWIEYGTLASNHLLAIINDVLDVSKIEAGEMTLQIKDISLHQICKNAIQLFHEKSNQKGLPLILDVSPQLATAYKADPLRLDQILYNLLNNALKFTHHGYVKLSVHPVEQKTNYDWVKFTIIDTGEGMSEEFANQIFEKFHQEQGRNVHKNEGTGLGMSITKELVSLMGGNIQVYSKKDEGTRVEVLLQLHLGNPVQIEIPESNFNKMELDGIRILLVEDNHFNRIVAQNTLKHFGAHVNEAEHGKQAIEWLSKNECDIVLMDLQMPEMNGIEAVMHIRNVLKLQIPVIALTANAFKSELEKCKNAGMDDYITKPFDENLLLQTILKYLPNTKSHLDVAEKIYESPYQLDELHKVSKGDLAFVRHMLGLFVTQTKEILAQWENAQNQNQWDEVACLIHKLIPSMDMLGMQKWTDTMRVLERWGKSFTRPFEVNQMSNQLIQDIHEVVVLLETLEIPKIELEFQKMEYRKT